MSVVNFPSATGRTANPPTRIDGRRNLRGDTRPSRSCVHDRYLVGRFVADVCPDSLEVTWRDSNNDEVDPALALAGLFGSFDLEAALDGIHAPSDTILVYRPDSRKGRAAMEAIPVRQWLLAAPGLWLTQDGSRLLLAPTDPQLAANLSRDLS